ncbi:MAG: glycosyltransferase family 4 protein, partial [Candidatus Omnitrophica bacterium]|nr:glycosyltransferase family 4 protein [Candidatus Omnitrophota bacterium]
MMSTGNSEKMNLRIAMVIATYFPVWGGAQVQLRQICRKLSAKGVSCFILTRRLPGTKNFEVINGIPVYRIYVTGKSKIIDSFLFISLSILWFLNNKDVFDAIHCYQAYSPATIGIITTLILRSKKVIVKVTSSDEYGEVAEIKKLPLYNIRISLLRRADRFLAVNKKVTEELIGLGIRRDMISYLPNGVEVPLDSCYDYSSKMNYRRRLGLDYARLACFTGRITREKNLEALITAWGYVIKQCSDAHLMFVGEGGA